MVLKVILGLSGMGLSYYALSGSDVMFLGGISLILVSLMLGDKTKQSIN